MCERMIYEKKTMEYNRKGKILTSCFDPYVLGIIRGPHLFQRFNLTSRHRDDLTCTSSSGSSGIGGSRGSRSSRIVSLNEASNKILHITIFRKYTRKYSATPLIVSCNVQ